MAHPTEGVLRRIVDEPNGVADVELDHVVRCESCRHDLDAIRADAELVRHALDVDVSVDVDAALRRFTSTPNADARVRAFAPPRSRRIRRAMRRPVAAGVTVAVVLAGAGVAAANDWIPIFRTEHIVPIAVDLADLDVVPDLTAYGDVVVDGEPAPRVVADAAAAGAATELDVPEVVRLPRGVSGDPTYRVGDEISATFTYRAARAARAAERLGEPLPTPPPGLDGTTVRLVAGPGVAEVWQDDRTGVPSLVVARAVAPTASSDGDVPFEAIRDHLLSLPGMPDDVAAQLRTFNAGPDTLPLPVPVDRFETSAVEVGDAEATLLTSRDGLFAAVVWVDDGIVTVVGGAISGGDAVAVARTLQ